MQALNYFFYESVKIIVLLFVMIFVVGFFRTYVPAARVKAWVSRRNRLVAHAGASVFGALTPFCSCSSIPLFLGFLEAGVPLGVGLSFLITSPLVNEYAFVLMLGLFGWKIAVAYAFTGIAVGILGGFVLSRFRLDRFVVKDLVASREESFSSLKGRLRFGVLEAASIVRKLWVWVLVGVGIGSLVHNYVPKGVLEFDSVFAVPLAVLVGVPMYANAAAVIPVVAELFDKGLPLGVSLAFIMSTVGLSLPEAVILRRAMRLPLIAAFFGVVAVGLHIVGFLF